MSDQDQVRRWLEHVTFGKGSGQSRSRSENINYRGNVMFSGSWAIGRLIKASNGKDLVCISRTGLQVKTPEKWVQAGYPNVQACIRVPCVGVYTWVPGDIVPEGDALNDRLQWLWLTQAHDIVSMARDMNQHRMFTQRGWTRGKKVEAQVEMGVIAKLYNDYADNVAKDWIPFADASDFAQDRLDDIVASKEEKYFSSESVMKREREVAKREARKALQV